MFDKRLFDLAPRTGAYVVAKVLCLWGSLLADIGFAFVAVGLLGNIFPVIASIGPATTNGKMPRMLKGFQAFPDNYSAFVFALIAVMAVKYLATRGANFFGGEAAEGVKFSLRQRLFQKMLDLGPDYSQRVRTGDVIQSLGEGVDQIQSFFSLFVPQLFFALIATLTLFVTLLSLNVPAALVLLVCAPLIVVIVGLVASSASRFFSKYWDRYTDLGACFLDDLEGLETLKTFDADQREAERMDSKAEEFRKATMNVLQIQLQSLSAMDLVSYGGAAAGIGVAIWQVVAGRLSLPAAMVIVLLSMSFFVPLRQLGTYFHVAMNGMTSSRRIFALLDVPVPDGGHAQVPAGACDCSITFSNITYSYPDLKAPSDQGRGGKIKADGADGGVGLRHGSQVGGDRARTQTTNALDRVSFTVRPNCLTVVVGASGSGKSTAARLVTGACGGYQGSLRFGYHVYGGVGSCEVRALTYRSLARTVTLVSAQSHLFAGTLRDNLLMAKPDATANEMWLALERAHIDDFVYSRHMGLDLPIEQGASNLSGGQRQRIAIARALLCDTPIYVFDEATSSVDVESERLILKTIHELARSHTVLMITHRMAHAAGADDIVVFDRGQVAQTGSHAALMKEGGRYAELYRAQESVERVSHRNGWGSDYSHPFETVGGFGRGRDSRLEENRDGEPDMTIETAVRGDVANPAVTSAPNADGPVVRTDRTSFDLRSNAAEYMGDFHLVLRLLGEAGPQAVFMVLACIFGTIGHLAGTFLPVFGVFALMAHFGHPLWSMGTGISIAAMVVCALLRGATRYLEQFMNHNAAFRLLASFRSKAFAALRRLAPAKLAGHGKGDLIALVTSDVELLEVFFAHTISSVAIAVCTTIVYAVVLWTFNPWFSALLIAAHLVVGVIVPRLFASNVRGVGAQIRADSAVLNDQMLDSMRGIDELIRFDQGRNRLASMSERSRALWLLNARLGRKNGVFAGISGILVIAFTAGAIGTALSLVEADPVGMSAAMVAAITLIGSSFGPALALSALPGDLTQAFAAARRMFSLLDEVPLIEETGTAKPRYTGMSMDNVVFSYTQQTNAMSAVRDAHDAGDSNQFAPRSHSVQPRPVLDGFNLHIARSGIIGIQGPSGRGKSTVLKLLMRYWDPQHGVVSLSGTPLPQVEAAYRRNVQTMMSQETYLFDGTIRDNLMIANASASDNDLHDALRKASVDDFVCGLPQGLDTRVGELGDRLSEGERQRIGLARIFLTNAELVLFDEPTSRLDALNEAVVLRSINTLAMSREVSIVLVSHRASTMRIVDRVVHL